MTSELRLLIPVPIECCASSTRTSRPAWASARATASPTTPAPMTTASTWFIYALGPRRPCVYATTQLSDAHRGRTPHGLGREQLLEPRLATKVPVLLSAQPVREPAL